ncbi:MAG: RNA polymerase sigma factor [Saprospiraceae bacterium]
MTNDRQLIQLTLAGNTAAFRQLVERYQEFVFTVTLRVLKQREEAEEAAQDTFVKVYKTLNSFAGESKFSTWLYTVAYRTALDRIRKKSRPVQSLDQDGSFLQIADSSKASTVLQQQDLKQTLAIVIDRLPAVEANLVTLFYLQEQSIKEISAITGLSISNVKVKLFRVREVLRRELRAYLGEEIADL